MAALNDLTWQQLEAAAGIAGAISIQGVSPNAKVMIDVSAILGIVVSDLSQQGVVDFLVKLRELCVSAQNSANSTQAVGERLSSFPPLSYGNLASDGTVQVQGNVVARMKVTPQTLHLIGTTA